MPLFFGACTALVDTSGEVLAANAASVVVFGRAVPDLFVSAVTGRDCSVVRLEQGDTYCRGKDATSIAVPFCSRSLGTVDCWSDPDALPDHPHPVADGPNSLTPAQVAHGTPRFPDL